MILDYPLFERLVYNLVTGFDVFGDLGHQTLTRLYMGLIRMEGEERFLNFLPAEIRRPIHESWYTGPLGDIFNRYAFGLVGVDRPTSMNYDGSQASPRLKNAYEPARLLTGFKVKSKFFREILTKRFNERVRGPEDRLNCGPPDRKELCDPADYHRVRWNTENAGPAPIAASIATKEDFEREMRKLANRPAAKAPFVGLLPDTAFLRVVVDGGAGDLVYTLIRTKEHFSIVLVTAELNRDEASDVIVFVPGLHASFPNRFFVWNMRDAPTLLKNLQDAKKSTDIDKLAVNRDDPEFWRYADWFQQRILVDQPITGGLIDLSSYDDYDAVRTK